MSDVMFVITGGGSGIGQALAWALADRGEKVLITGRRAECLATTKQKFSSMIETLVGDVTDADHLFEICEYTKSHQLKGLVQNAAQLTPMGPLVDMDLVEFQRHQQVNVEAPLALFQHLHTQLSGAKVLHISSGAAHTPYASWGAYCVSKASLHMMWQLLKIECPDIAFGSVMPGVTDTNMQALIRQESSMPEQSRAFFKTLHQEDRLLTPATVAQFLTWLLLDIDNAQYTEHEWDIYDPAHHQFWLTSANKVPSL